MANHKSALKAYRQTIRRHQRNRQARSKLRTALKAMRVALNQGRKDEARQAFSRTVSLIDKMAGKGIIHDNAAARYKSRLARRLAS